VARLDKLTPLSPDSLSPWQLEEIELSILWRSLQRNPNLISQIKFYHEGLPIKFISSENWCRAETIAVVGVSREPQNYINVFWVRKIR
jgi:hypothetical protein